MADTPAAGVHPVRAPCPPSGLSSKLFSGDVNEHRAERLEVSRWQSLAADLARLSGGASSVRSPVAEAWKPPSAPASLSPLGTIRGHHFWSPRWIKCKAASREAIGDTDQYNPGPTAQFPGLRILTAVHEGHPITDCNTVLVFKYFLLIKGWN